MAKLNNIVLLLVLVASIVFLCVFTVYETDRAIILRFNKIKVEDDSTAKVYEPGLHVKVPFIDEVRMFDTRLSILDIKASRITTREKKDMLVDYYVQWRIKDFSLYYRRTQGIKSRAEALLEEKANAILKIEFGRLTIKEVVSGERIELMERLRKITDENAENMGIMVLDVRVKRVDLPAEVSSSVYTRMRAERERKANELRADGEKEAIEIRAKADKRRRVIIAEAERDSKHLRGEGDAKAVEVYANSYNKSPQFYEFYRSMEAYRNVLRNKGDVLVLKPDSDFFKYFRDFKGESKSKR